MLMRGRMAGKIADVFTLSAGLVRIYVGKTVLEYCDGNNCGGTSDGRREILYDECGRLQSL